MELKTYYDFAENDYKFIMEVFEHQIFANSLGALCQNTCERYIKHLINTFIKVDEDNRDEMTDVLSTHNLVRLLGYWNKYGFCAYDEETVETLKAINGYYFSTKYPGDDCLTLSEEEIEECVNATKLCKESTDKILNVINGGLN